MHSCVMCVADFDNQSLCRFANRHVVGQLDVLVRTLVGRELGIVRWEALALVDF